MTNKQTDSEQSASLVRLMGVGFTAEEAGDIRAAIRLLSAEGKGWSELPQDCRDQLAWLYLRLGGSHS